MAVHQTVDNSIPSKPFNRSNALTVRAEPFTDVHEYGPLNSHLGVHEDDVAKIGFSPHCLLANICQ